MAEAAQPETPFNRTPFSLPPPPQGWPMTTIMKKVKATIKTQCIELGLRPIRGRTKKGSWAAVLYDYGQDPLNQPGGGAIDIQPQVHGSQPVFVGSVPVSEPAINDSPSFFIDVGVDEFADSEDGVDVSSFAQQLSRNNEPPPSDYDIFAAQLNEDNGDDEDAKLNQLNEENEEPGSVEDDDNESDLEIGVSMIRRRDEKSDEQGDDEQGVIEQGDEQGDDEQGVIEQGDDEQGVIEPARVDFDAVEDNSEVHQFCIMMDVKGRNATILCEADIFYLEDLLSHTMESFKSECGFPPAVARHVFNKCRLYEKNEQYGAIDGAEGAGGHPQGAGGHPQGAGGPQGEGGDNGDEGDEEEKKQESENVFGNGYGMMIIKNKNRLYFSIPPTPDTMDLCRIACIKVILKRGLLNTLEAITHVLDNNTKNGDCASVRYYHNGVEFPYAPVRLCYQIMGRFKTGGLSEFDGLWRSTWKGGNAHYGGPVVWCRPSVKYSEFSPNEREAQNNCLLNDFRGCERELYDYIARVNDTAGCLQLGWIGNNNVALNYDLSLEQMMNVDGVDENLEDID